MNEAVEKHRADHLPTPWWELVGSVCCNREVMLVLKTGGETLEEESARKGIPPLPGRQAVWTSTREMKGKW